MTRRTDELRQQPQGPAEQPRDRRDHHGQQAARERAGRGEAAEHELQPEVHEHGEGRRADAPQQGAGGRPDALGPQDLEGLELEGGDLALVAPSEQCLEAPDHPQERRQGRDEQGGGAGRAPGPAGEGLGLAGRAVGPDPALDPLDDRPREDAAVDLFDPRVGVGHEHQEAVGGHDVDHVLLGRRPHRLHGDGPRASHLLDALADQPGALVRGVQRHPPHVEERRPVELDRRADARDLRLGAGRGRGGRGRRGRGRRRRGVALGERRHGAEAEHA